jgi:hypothetical protein
MADPVSKVEYYTIPVAHRPGAAAEVLSALSAGGVNLIGFWGYPMGPDSGNLEIAPEDPALFRKVAKKAKLEIGEKHIAFFVSGKDKAGAVAAALSKVAAAGINVHAAQAVAAGGKYGALIYVQPDDVKRAQKALGS